MVFTSPCSLPWYLQHIVYLALRLSSWLIDTEPVSHGMDCQLKQKQICEQACTHEHFSPLTKT